AIDEHAHRLRAVGRDPDERASEVAEGLAGHARGRGDALRDVAIDADARRVHEDASVDFADVDRSAARSAQETRHIPATARVAKRAREVISRSDRIERKSRGAAGYAVRDLVRGAVAASRDDDAVSIRRAL